jgi:hypothetical protein
MTARRRCAPAAATGCTPAATYAGRVDLIGYLAGGLAIACLIALAVLGDRRVRTAVAACALLAAVGYGLFLGWLTLYGE